MQRSHDRPLEAKTLNGRDRRGHGCRRPCAELVQEPGLRARVLVLRLRREPGAHPACSPPASAPQLVTAGGLLLLWRGSLRGGQRASDGSGTTSSRASLFAVGVTLLAATLTVFLRHPALPVLAVGSLAGACEIMRGRLDVRGVLDALGTPVLLALFSLSVPLGVLARSSTWAAHLLEHAGRWETAGAVAVNNLPAAVLRSARPIPHPRALLFGLNLGPNLAVTGLLSYLRYRSAPHPGARPSASEFSRRGVLLAPPPFSACRRCQGCEGQGAGRGEDAADQEGYAHQERLMEPEERST